jgi:hypothetical protein
MATFYFHLRYGRQRLDDREGRDIAADEVAAHALREARAIIAEDAQGGRVDLRYWIDVEDEEGRTVHSLGFADAIEVAAPATAATRLRLCP